MTDSAATEAARALAARRPTETIVCEVCGTTREAVRHRGRTNRFCSDACRDRARRTRERQAKAQQQP